MATSTAPTEAPPPDRTPDPAAPALAVVIPHFEDHDRLARCLAALAAQGLDGVEAVVVDNGSSRPVAPLVARHPGIGLLAEPARGAAAARNRGVAATRAPWIAFLDADCVPGPGWLDRARALAAGAARGDLVGGQVALFDEGAGPRSGAQAFETVFAFDTRGYVERKGFAVTANLLARRAAFDAVGGFAPGLAEDLEWCRRATAAGWRLAYDEALAVAHPTRGDWPALERKWRRLTAEGFALEGPRPAGRIRWALRALAMPASAAAHLPRLLLSPRLAGPGERLRGAGVLLRLRLLRMVWMLRQAAGGAV